MAGARPAQRCERRQQRWRQVLPLALLPQLHAVQQGSGGGGGDAYVKMPPSGNTGSLSTRGGSFGGG